MKFTAAGDAIIGKRIPKNFKGYEELNEFIQQGDARFFNLETTLNYEGDCFASQFSGGTYLRTNPEVLEDLKKFGFNMTSFNNNHAMDYSFDGFLKTFQYVKESGLVQAGCGRNLAEASAPKYLDTEKGRVALIAVNTSFNASMMAGVQTERIKGRPGVNGLRITHTSYVSKEDFESLKAIADRTNINANEKIMIKEGYSLKGPDDEFSYGDEKFKIGEPGVDYTANRVDIERIKTAIYESKLQADYIMISIHTHQLIGDKKETPPKYFVELSHELIDAGADAIIGHGPHLLRPIEVYNNRPIFYSLGDFILQLYNVEFAPEEMYARNRVSHHLTTHDLLKSRSKNFTIGLMEDLKMAETVVPYWETDENNNLIKLVLMPITLDMHGLKSQEGLPRRDYNPAFLERLQEMSKPFGVDIKMNDEGLLECKW